MAKKKEQQLVINQIITRPANRQILDVGKWRTALRSADMGKYQQLLDLYDDIMLDGVLADAVDKRIRAVTGADLTFQYKDGTEGEEMIAFIDTLEFEKLLTEIMQALFQYVSVTELTFDEKGMHVYSVPRKHIRAEQHSIAINENDPLGSIPYADIPNIIEVRNPKDKYGVLIRACPYAIFKRGGLSDWAQMVEIFGMPKRIGKYSIYDVEARKALEEAFNSQGAAATLIVPKETDIETDNSSTAVNSTLYKDFIDTLDDQLLITILSQTMTTKDGSSRSQSETHKEVQEELNKHDLRFVQRVLNQKILPLLETRGYPVKDGTFVFPKATEQPTVSELVQLSEILDIPAYYLQERYGIPQAADGDVLAKRQQATQEPEPTKTPKDKKDEPLNNADQERNFFMRLRDFFADAPTRRSGANLKQKWTNSIINAADTFRYHIDINRLFEQAIREVYADAGEDTINATLYELCNQPLQQAVTKGFTTSWGKKNETFVQEFRQNTAVFAAFKAHRQGNDIAAKLLDENGNLRSFHEFKKAVLGSSINADYNKNWLKTEYNMAVRAARNAEKFKRFEAVKHLYHNLEYVESTAVHKRAEHLAYVGTVLPIEHPWWDTHTPPLDWGCECSIRNTDKPVTAVPQDDTSLNPVLANNPAKTAEFLRMEKHPYIKGVCRQFATCQWRKNNLLQLADAPNKPECAICLMAANSKQKAERIRQNRAEYERLKADHDYKDVKFDKKTGGLKATHVGHIDHTNEKAEFFGMNPTQLENACQNNIYRMGHSAVFCNESIQSVKGKNDTALDILLDGKRMDIASVTKDVMNYKNILNNKNSQLKRYNELDYITEKANAVCLYFHDPAMYSDQKVREGMEKLKAFEYTDKDTGGIRSITIRIKHVYCVVNGAEDIMQFDF